MCHYYRYISFFVECQYGVDTKHLQIDFSEDGYEIYEKISVFLDKIDIGILVNNVGMQGDDTSYFLDIPNMSKRIHDTINVNIYAQVKVSKLNCKKNCC